MIVAFLFSAASWMTRRTAAEASRPLVRLEAELKSNGVLGSEVGIDAIISPDGTRVAFVSRDADGQTHLNTRRLDQPAVAVIAGTEGVRGPFFSPDGQWVGFFADRKLKRWGSNAVRPPSSATHPIFSAQAGVRGRHHRRGIHPHAADARRRPKAARRAWWRTSPARSITPRWPQVLPGGNLILFTAVGPAGPNMATIDAAYRCRMERSRRSCAAARHGRYLANGYLT